MGRRNVAAVELQNLCGEYLAGDLKARPLRCAVPAGEDVEATTPWKRGLGCETK